MNSQVKTDIKKLNRGELPDSLNFSIKQDNSIDWVKVKYNSLYKDYSHYEKKFPAGYESIPGFEKILTAMAQNALTPIEEYDTKIDEKNNLVNYNEC